MSEGTYAELLDKILRNALSQGADEIYLIPEIEHVNLCWQIDNELYTMFPLSFETVEELALEIKKRVGDDTLTHTHEGELYRFRYSTIEYELGEVIKLAVDY